MATEFIHLNSDWNAEPNAPEEEIRIQGETVELIFYLNPWAYEGFAEDERGKLVFKKCRRYRLGLTNDEGWYRGQCRFSKLAPKWGEFYEIRGDTLIDKCPDDWVEVGPHKGDRHFLFYFRDNTFECVAADFDFIRF